jgi:EAL domain-containing protein (putative c-di-GMP-specific phosphodiesterase class I)
METDKNHQHSQCSKCVLCSFRGESRRGDDLFLYASTPILRHIVESNLRDLQVSFQLENDLFRIDQGEDVAIRGLLDRLSEAERADIRATQASGAAMLGASSLEALGKRLNTAWFDEALRADSFTTFFQPIVDTWNSRAFAHECLIRLFSDRAYSGGEIIETAISRGRIHLFDSYARRLSIRSAGQQSLPGTKVFINFMPSSIYDPALCMASTLEELAKTSIEPRDIVFEVVESDHVRDVKQLKKICDYYRKKDFGFALDDVGTGTNSLQMVCDLKPDYIKLDKSLVSGISDPMYKTAVHKLAEFADQFGLQVIAEGVETVETAQTLQTMGIHLMQGYYFGKPAPTMSGCEMPAVEAPEQLTAG